MSERKDGEIGQCKHCRGAIRFNSFTERWVHVVGAEATCMHGYELAEPTVRRKPKQDDSKRPSLDDIFNKWEETFRALAQKPTKPEAAEEPK